MTHLRLLRTVLATTVVAVATTTAWSAGNSLHNGSFESFVSGPGGAVQITAWDSQGVTLVNAIPGGGALGQHSAQLAAVGYLKQSFSVLAGKTYEARFVIGASTVPAAFWGRLGADPSTVAGVDTLAIAGCGGFQSWGVTGTDSCVQFNSASAVTQQGFRWTATTSGTAWLSFMTLASQQSQGGVIDGVVLSQVTAVPEPSTVALMLAGLGVVAVLARRRRATSPAPAAA